MNPEPLCVNSDNLIEFETKPGEITNTNFEELSDKELLFRQVMVSQSIRLMMIFLFAMGILNIVGFIVIVRILLG